MKIASNPYLNNNFIKIRQLYPIANIRNNQFKVKIIVKNTIDFKKFEYDMHNAKLHCTTIYNSHRNRYSIK